MNFRQLQAFHLHFHICSLLKTIFEAWLLVPLIRFDHFTVLFILCTHFELKCLSIMIRCFYKDLNSTLQQFFCLLFILASNWLTGFSGSLLPNDTRCCSSDRVSQACLTWIIILSCSSGFFFFFSFSDWKAFLWHEHEILLVLRLWSSEKLIACAETLLLIYFD